MDDAAEYQKLRRNMKVAQGSSEGHPGSNDAISSVIYSAEGEELTINCEAESESSGQRDQWSRGVEFLFSCIALSVGLGNVWRFPFIALENGGGAFLIPYVHCAPADWQTAYYACIMALTIMYLVASFSEVLPWTYCLVEWGKSCVATGATAANDSSIVQGVSSAELFFTQTVLREPESLDDNGLGTPSWDLVLCLLATWVIIGTILSKGIRSSGKASYFLALFPYVIMVILLIRAVTLPGAWQGIVYFLKPQWSQLLNPHVWYAAITQMFFSLAICFGTLVMYASFNDFNKNVHKDVIIITTIDSLTSILAGCIIFGILGNLAFETNTKDISQVVKGGAGLAFISYPEAIAKFKYLPQLFAVLFFFMLLVLGIGSNIGMASAVVNVVKDRFTHLPHWLLAVGASIIGFLCGLVYMTPGGQFVLNLVDFYGCTFIALVLAIAELLAVGWIYGVKRICSDIEFMLNVKTSFYWRICWAIVAPGLMFLVLVYMLLATTSDVQGGSVSSGLLYGWLDYLGTGCAAAALLGFFTIYQQPGKTFGSKFRMAMQPTANWGPLQTQKFEAYILHRKREADFKSPRGGYLFDNIFG
ncbi:GD25852 [Drosophila simulans]|uniref:Transporter n=1 Tax=Drosophila simulans TaxID=7240 RepID=B4QC99_DROSI|nr:GD25852 [Drosophila simulans]